MIASRNRADIRLATISSPSGRSERSAAQPAALRPIPKPVANASDAGLQVLLQLEVDARNATTCEELQYLAANDTRNALRNSFIRSPRTRENP